MCNKERVEAFTRCRSPIPRSQWVPSKTTDQDIINCRRKTIQVCCSFFSTAFLCWLGTQSAEQNKLSRVQFHAGFLCYATIVTTLIPPCYLHYFINRNLINRKKLLLVVPTAAAAEGSDERKVVTLIELHSSDIYSHDDTPSINEASELHTIMVKIEAGESFSLTAGYPVTENRNFPAVTAVDTLTVVPKSFSYEEFIHGRTI